MEYKEIVKKKITPAFSLILSFLLTSVATSKGKQIFRCKGASFVIWIIVGQKEHYLFPQIIEEYFEIYKWNYTVKTNFS